jgi:hypothetical protein
MHIHDDLPLQPLPFPGALYRVGTAESHSGNSLAGWSLPVSLALSTEFAIAPGPSGPAAKLMSLVPSRRAVAARLRRKVPPRRR